MNKSEDQLRQTGLLVESIPEPEDRVGFIPVLSCNQADGLYYRYDPCPESEPSAGPTLDYDYDALVNSYIRERYTLSQELAMLRQQETKTDEYTAYYAYAEECKARARNQMQNQ